MSAISRVTAVMTTQKKSEKNGKKQGKKEKEKKKKKRCRFMQYIVDRHLQTFTVL
jgi:hypothetical protein